MTEVLNMNDMIVVDNDLSTKRFIETPEPDNKDSQIFVICVNGELDTYTHNIDDAINYARQLVEEYPQDFDYRYYKSFVHGESAELSRAYKNSLIQHEQTLLTVKIIPLEKHVAKF